MFKKMDNVIYSKKKKMIFSIITFFLILLFVFGAGEILARFFWKGCPQVVSDERNLTYRYDRELGWFPIENSNKQFEGTRLISVKHNQDGFRDIEHGAKTKKRIAFIGDSYVWGFDVEQNERFTEKLQLLLPDWEVLNMGVSGYGNDQEFILLQKWFDRYKPDIVFLMFCENDWSENCSSIVHTGYYKPYFEIVDGKLIKKGVPVNKSLNYYRREHPFIFKSKLLQLFVSSYLNLKAPMHKAEIDPTGKIIPAIRDYVESKGSRFMMAFIFPTEHEKKQALCEPAGIDYLFLGDNELYTTHGWHWTPLGHDSVCAKTYRFLQTRF
jgi:hypothetical protein